MEEKRINNTDQAFDIQVEELKDLVNKFMQREHGSDDVDFMEQKGGEEWLSKGLKTDPKNGI